jgi:hypothetical protein
VTGVQTCALPIFDWSWPKTLICLAAAVALWRKVDPIWVVLAGVALGLVFL